MYVGSVRQGAGCWCPAPRRPRSAPATLTHVPPSDTTGYESHSTRLRVRQNERGAAICSHRSVRDAAGTSVLDAEPRSAECWFVLVESATSVLVARDERTQCVVPPR